MDIEHIEPPEDPKWYVIAVEEDGEWGIWCSRDMDKAQATYNQMLGLFMPDSDTPRGEVYFIGAEDIHTILEIYGNEIGEEDISPEPDKKQ